MPVEEYEVVVNVSDEIAGDDVPSLIAESSRYLAYADQTDTFGYGGRVYEAVVYNGDETEYQVGLKFTAPIASDEDRERFLDEMDMLAHVNEIVRLK